LKNKAKESVLKDTRFGLKQRKASEIKAFLKLAGSLLANTADVRNDLYLEK
jgi:hypothetical protein